MLVSVGVNEFPTTEACSSLDLIEVKYNARVTYTVKKEKVIAL